MTAIVVAHDGARWLSTALASVAGQDRPVQRMIAVDTGSRDDTARLLVAALPAADIVTTPHDTSYGGAVALGLAAAGPARGRARKHGVGDRSIEWIWLLHDDCAPAPGCLRALLELADRAPAAAVIGPKVRDWDDPRRLVEVGLTTDTAGRLVTGLERREMDQGQFGAPRAVLAVGTAGALVRRDVWESLGGLDPQLPLFRDDVDFGWRVNLAGHRVLVAPNAALRHARAATTGARPLAAVSGRATGIDRRHALYTLLVNISLPALLLAVPRLLLATVVRSVVLLLTRRPGAAAEEIAALVFTLGHPSRLLAARRYRAATRVLAPRAVRPLLAGRTARVRHYAEAFAALGTTGDGASVSSPGARRGETGPSQADDELDAAAGVSLGRRLLLQPGVILVVGLLVVALAAEHALFGSGRLVGARMLPAPTGASELWSSYVSGWHRVGAGSAVPAPPYLAVLAALATVLFGKAWLAVDVLLLASVPLAGLSAYVAARRVVVLPALRCWAAAVYALVPVLTGAVATGRLGVAVGTAVLPMLLLGGWRVLREDPAEAGWRRAWATGLGLALATAFAPLLYLVAAVLLLGGFACVLVVGRSRGAAGAARRALAAGITVAVPPLVLLPWTAYVVTHPGIFLLGIGRITPEPSVPGWQLVLLHPGGPGLPPVWLAVPVLIAALVALFPGPRRTIAAGGFALAAVGFATALVATRWSVVPAAGGPALAGWPGIGVAVSAAGLLLAALVAADRAPERLGRRSFGWRQPVAVLLTVTAGLVPLVAAAAWLHRGADGPLQRLPTAVLPAFAAALAGANERVLFLHVDDGGTVDYDLAGPGGTRLADADLRPSAGQRGTFDGLVRRLVSSSGAGAAVGLATYDVRFVVLAAHGPEAGIAERLDAQPGLSRTSYEGTLRLWAVTPAYGRLAVLSPASAGTALRPALPGPDAATAQPSASTGSGPLSARQAQSVGQLPAGPAGAVGTLAPGPTGRLLVFSEARDDGWRATVDGRLLPARTAWGWAQAFAVPPEGGRLRLHYDDGWRTAELIAAAVLLGLIVVLAAPSPRRRDALASPVPTGDSATKSPGRTAASTTAHPW